MTTLNFDVFWRDHGASRGLKSLGQDAQESRKHVDTLGAHGKQLAAGFAGFAAARIFDSFIEGARESNMISRVTEERIRSTGGAAHVTADQVGDLATAISNKTGADDEAVQSGANMLLTFTRVRNEVGRGNDVFNQATSAATDLAAGLHQGQVTAEGTQQAATLLGKALNDPIQGMTALRRVGISFTASQVQQITALQKSGRTLEAQKIILAEVNKEFGGTARAAADPLQRMSVILGNVGEDIGNKLLPGLNKAADIMTAIPGPVYMAGAAFVTLGVGVIGVAKGVNAVRDVAQGTAGVMRILGLRTGEAAAAETAQAAAARTSAASTAAAGDAAAVAGTKFGTLAGRLALGGAVVGLAALSSEATAWSGHGDVAAVSTDRLAASMLQMQRTGQATGPVFDLLNVNSMRLKAHIDTSSEAFTRFGDEARGAFSMGIADIIGRAQTGTERLERFNATASQMDTALAQLVRSGHGADASVMFEQLKQATGLTGDELQHVINRFPQYQAAAAQAARQTDATARAIGDQNSALLGVQHGGNIATNALRAVAGATDAATGAAHRHTAATKAELAELDKNADQVLSLRQADRELAQSRADLTQSIKDNKRGLDINTAAGRANADALDRTAKATRDDLQAHRDAGEPMRRYTQRVHESEAALIREAQRAGMSRTAAKRYADAILAVPRRQVVDYQTRGAAAAQKAARDLNYWLQHIRSASVRVHLNADGNYVQGTRVLRAKGGAIPSGMGRRGIDSVPALLTPDEHVWTTSEVAAVGGHGPMMRLRKAALAGQLQGYAGGGPVNRRALTLYDDRLPSSASLQSRLNRIIAAGVGGFQPTGGGPVPGGSRVARWGPMMRLALTAVGLPQSYWPNEMRQIQTESGGNPNAVQGNIGDINNRTGDLAKGLLQIIGATYRAYHWPGTAWNVFDPWSNMTTSLNYQKHRYGSQIPAVIGHGHGYADGTRHAAPGWRWVGERGPELVNFRGGEQVVPSRRSLAGGAPVVNVNLTVSAPNYVGSRRELAREMRRSGEVQAMVREIVKAVR